MLIFNTFRARRYLRSDFVQGKYLLASELGDVELEIIDLFRKAVKDTIGDVALADAWKVEFLSHTQLLIKPGEAWQNGLPFSFRSGNDQLVSGAILSAGIVPNGVTITDDASGLGKIITFTQGTTPTNTYRMTVTASEQLITASNDPFLQNVNLTESTAEKIRLNFQINIVPDSLQTSTPVPYTDETSSSVSVTNFPNTGGQAAPNLSNQVTITPAASMNGELLQSNPIVGAQQLDGRSLELVVRNDSTVGSGLVLPTGTASQAAFTNGILTDSNGNEYWINAVYNGQVVSGKQTSVIRIDQEYLQPAPVITNGVAYTLTKRDVYIADDSTGLPAGKLYWAIAKLNWNTTSGIAHPSDITDLRNSVDYLEDYEIFINYKDNLRLVGGGNISFSTATNLLTWASTMTLLNPSGTDMTIAANSAAMLEDGALAYTLAIPGGGAIGKGTLGVTVTSFGATSTLSATSLGSVTIGNAVVDSAGTLAQITGIDNVNSTITTTPALTANGSATIYLDSYGPGTVPLAKETYVLAVRKNNVVLVDGQIGLANGESGQIGQGISNNNLAFMGATSGADSSPVYSTNYYVTNGESLVAAISALDASLNSLASGIKASYYNPVSTTLPTGTTVTTDGVVNVNGDTVLFSNLASGNNQIYTLSGVGTALTWTPLTPFTGGSATPSIGDSVRIKSGAAFAEQLAVFDGTYFKVNDVVRLFDGVSGDFWELGSIKTATLTNNTTGNIFTVSVSGSENLIIPYSVYRGTAKETGQLVITSDDTNASISKTASYIGSTGTSFSAVVSGGNLELNYTTDSSGSSGSMKFFLQRWSNAAGGPTGVPSYSGGGGGGSTPAAGSPGNVQFAGPSGSLAADSRFNWDSSNGALNLSGLEYVGLSAPMTLADNQVSPATLFAFSTASYNYAMVEYSFSRNGDYRTGTLVIAANSSNVGFTDDYVETNDTGITFYIAATGGTVSVQYATTSTGFTGTYKYSIRKWN